MVRKKQSESEKQQATTSSEVASAKPGLQSPSTASPASSSSEASSALESTAVTLEANVLEASVVGVKELETKIADLTSALQAADQTAQQREQELLQKIAHLQAQIQEQTATFQTTLQEQQDSYAKLQAELEAAKQGIFQLSQMNAKPPAPTASTPPAPTASTPPLAPPAPATSKSVARAKSTRPEIIPVKPQAAEPELEPSQSKIVLPPQSSPRKLPTERKRYEVALHRILDHPTQPGSLPSMSSEPPAPVDKTKKLSDTDMGWVD
ncbi:MAG TPA: hypothetical protein V6C65_03620 [Allocoleopsis sp.]